MLAFYHSDFIFPFIGVLLSSVSTQSRVLSSSPSLLLIFSVYCYYYHRYVPPIPGSSVLFLFF